MQPSHWPSLSRAHRSSSASISSSSRTPPARNHSGSLSARVEPRARWGSALLIETRHGTGTAFSRHTRDSNMIAILRPAAVTVPQLLRRARNIVETPASLRLPSVPDRGLIEHSNVYVRIAVGGPIPQGTVAAASTSPPRPGGYAPGARPRNNSSSPRLPLRPCVPTLSRSPWAQSPATPAGQHQGAHHDRGHPH